MAPVSGNLLKLARSLFEDEGRQSEFVDCLQQTSPENVQALLWVKSRPQESPFAVAPARTWQPDFVDILAPGQRAGVHDLHSGGSYYLLESSSVFTASAMLALQTRPAGILDMCAAPGGKGIFAWRAFSPELLLCNEVIGKRIGALVSNLKRCAVKPVYVVSRDSSRFDGSLHGGFDLVICDVPCSGQSLIIRKGRSPGCFHPATINLNSNRQKRIVANSAALVSPGGALHYATCTYARQENEAVIEWFLRKFPFFKPLPVPALQEYQSHLADFPAYRLWPQQGLGAGGFCCLLQKSGEKSPQRIDLAALKIIWENL